MPARSALPFAQLAEVQVVPSGCRRQVPWPLQPPRRPQVAADCAGHWARGSWPTGTGWQVPRLPGRAQV